MELKEAKKWLKDNIKYYEEQIEFINITDDSDYYDEEKDLYIKRIEIFKVILQVLDNSIPKEKVEEEIEELSKKLNVDDNIRIYTLKGSYELQIAILQELLEEQNGN